MSLKGLVIALYFIIQIKSNENDTICNQKTSDSKTCYLNNLTSSTSLTLEVDCSLTEYNIIGISGSIEYIKKKFDTPLTFQIIESCSKKNKKFKTK
jgi:hypothetical protein